MLWAAAASWVFNDSLWAKNSASCPTKKSDSRPRPLGPLTITQKVIRVEDDLDGTFGHELMRGTHPRGSVFIYPATDGRLVAPEQCGEI